MNTLSSLSEKIAKAQTLDFGQIFSDALELYKKTWLQGFLMQLFALIVMLPILIIFYVPFIGVIIAQQNSGYADTEALENFMSSMSVPYIILLVACVIVLGTLTYALNAAFFNIMKKLDYNEQSTTSDFLAFFKMPYLIKIFLLMLVAVLIAIPSALLCYIPLIYTIVPMSFFMAVFAFNPDLSVGDIISVSFKLGNKKYFLSLGLLVLSYLCILVLSFVTCGVGGLFIQSFLFHPTYLIYKNVIGFNEAHVIDQIGETTE
ncbi:hypothetical protein [Aestuariibaculum sediminum]|uniref:Glycerophosphoryl diester phosphodiesterase membrane domain-containing protein n=1 Tax=Aestuariibaculum sediminum TaxID=2770637 RepID=A0A8J6Q3X7_9FLAO|nr:hypothetical protein [Aestuariibaculum sediminum]MBD0832840.1 hypothetical protein [Aestuariibaculum sediminum]